MELAKKPLLRVCYLKSSIQFVRIEQHHMASRRIIIKILTDLRVKEDKPKLGNTSMDAGRSPSPDCMSNSQPYHVSE